ncbi:hypothetical protein [Actinotalea sp.]|uniref:hypothetical protein n=1 Tax=Actinotalea sp. TaxID=1872145 RepID=UPI002C152B93|nr:hypothetical protein [Actinotalea sp.]HRA50188.1 hypothetical protein [Actinotalea sp.]
MSTTSPTTASPLPARSSVAVTTRWLLRQHLRVALWAVIIALMAVTVAVVMVDRYGTVDISIVQFARQGFVWFPFSMAIMMSAGFLNVHVASGLTRRSLGRASVVVGVGLAGFYAVVMTAALQLERAVFGARGWAHQLTDGAPVVADTSQIGWILVDLGLLFTAAQLSGLLVGISYYRLGPWWATLALPLTVGPVLVVTPILTTSLLDPLSMLARVPVAVALLVLTAAAYLVLLRRCPVRPVAA